MTARYSSDYARSLRDPNGFWEDAASDIHWFEKWDRVLDDAHPPFYRWFPGGRLNTCYNAIDRHVEGGRAEQIALIYDSPVTHTVKRFTFRELKDAVSRVAGAFREQGVDRGDQSIRGVTVQLSRSVTFSTSSSTRSNRIFWRPTRAS